MSQKAFTLIRPKVRRGCVVFASPHSGRAYDRAFAGRTRLDERELRSSEDAFVDDLFAMAPQAGAPLLAAAMPRAYVDLNRASDEFDPALIEGVRRSAPGPRVSSGLGVIPRVVAGGRAIYDGKIPLEEARARIDRVWRPYHAQLGALLDEARATFGRAILFDCHSMPHAALDQNEDRPDVVIGDRFGAAASARIVSAVETTFRSAGLRVARNTPFAGAFITQAYGRPSRGRHVIQIEIDRALYMDERRIARHEGFAALQDRLAQVIPALVEIGATDRGDLAAE